MTPRKTFSPQERRDRETPEIALQRYLVGKDGLAGLLGWESLHVRPAQTAHGWRTPTSGSLASGWFDLILARERDRRLVFAELKSQRGDVRDEQLRVADLFRAIAGELAEVLQARHLYDVPRIDVVLWRPSDMNPGPDGADSPIVRILR